MIPSPYQCDVKLSFGDYEIYTRAAKAICPNFCSKLDVLGRAIFMAGKYLTHFRPCNVVEFIIRNIEIVTAADSVTRAEAEMYKILDSDENGLAYYNYCKDQDGNPINKNLAKRKAYAEAKIVLKELYQWKNNGMI